MLLTYAPSLKSPRHEYATKTLRAVLDKLRFSGEIAVHIADDGSPNLHRQSLRKLAGGYKHVVTVGESNSERRGYGASYNLATQMIHPSSDIVLPLEDDWELTGDLDLDPLVEGLTSGAFGCIRLGYLGFTQKLHGSLVNVGQTTYLAFDPRSPEPHVWAGHPRLETVQWQRDVGPWPEGLGPGETEFAVAHKEEARWGVGWPIYYAQAFAHIGTVQAREDQSGSTESADAS